MKTAPLRNALLSFCVASLGAGGCFSAPDGTAIDEGTIQSENGLMSINGVGATNGLMSINGFNASNGLMSINGLSSTVGLMTTIDGRKTVEYLVRCALPAGSTLTKQDQNGTTYTFQGSLGFAPEWATGKCDQKCQEYVSACMMAHINTAGVHIPLWIVAPPAAVGWSLSPDYPNQEGTFFGNVFTPGAHGGDPTKIQAFYCNGRSYNVDTVPGRIGADQVGAPYTNPLLATNPEGYCADKCVASDAPYADSGFKACLGWNNPVTTYRKAATGGTITAMGTGTAAVLTATITKYSENAKGYCANIAIKNSGGSPASSWTVTYDIATSKEKTTWFGAFNTVTDSVHTVKGSGPAQTIPAGGTRTVGFCVNGTGTPSIRSVTTL